MANPTQYVAIRFGSSGWVDVTADAGNITINKGTTRVAEDYQAGSLSVTFTNNKRRFDPLNTSSDLYYSAGGYSLVQPGAEVLVTSNSQTVFDGYVQDWSFSFGEAGLDGNATLTAGDFLYYVSRINFDASQETLARFTTDRVADVLQRNSLGTAQVQARNASTLVGADSHAIGDNVLSYLQNVARSEPADLYADRFGNLVFKDRTFTNYLWATSYRYNLIKYPSANTIDTTSYPTGNGDGWINRYLASTAVYIYGGTSFAAEPRPAPNSDTYLQYREINQAKYNPSNATGKSYVFSGWFKGNGLTNTGITGTFTLLDSAGNTINSGGVPLTMTATTATNAIWANMSGTVTANASSTVAGINISVTAPGTATASYSYVGNAWIVEDASTYDGNYFDGSNNPSANATKTQYQVAWFGQAYSSSSVLAKKTNSITPSAQTYVTFADANSQGTAYGNGTAIPFTEIEIASSALNLYNQVQVGGVNATATKTDTAGTALYGLKTFSQTDNLTTSITRPAEIAQDFLGVWRLPEYRANSFTIALENLTSTQQNIVLGLELRDVIRLCFQPSATGSVVDKLYQILSINTQADVERHHISFQVASLSNVPIRLNSEYVAQLNSSILG